MLENLPVDLAPIEEARGLCVLSNWKGWSQDEAAALGLSKAAVSATLRSRRVFWPWRRRAKPALSRNLLVESWLGWRWGRCGTACCGRPRQGHSRSRRARGPHAAEVVCSRPIPKSSRGADIARIADSRGGCIWMSASAGQPPEPRPRLTAEGERLIVRPTELGSSQPPNVTPTQTWPYPAASLKAT